MDENNPELCYCGRVDSPEEEGNSWASIKFVRSLRRLRWEIEVDWCEEDKTRVYSSSEMLPEDVQDYSIPMTIIGSDVVALYPNIEVTRAAEIMKEAVMKSEMEFDNIDLMECSRYVALNWTNAECRTSKLRRVLPWRRKNRGTRPGVRGIGHVEEHVEILSNGSSLTW